MDKKSIRVNEQIRWKEVRLIGESGEPLGIVPMAEALQKAKEAALDLVEIAPTAKPPVCRIMNFGKFIYQQKKKQQDSKKKQKTTQVKEVKFRPNIDDHDYDFKIKHILKFLAHGDKVKATVQFRGREMARRENGQKVLDRLLIDLTGHAIAESRSEMLGNRLYQILAPVKHHEKAAAKAGA
ncbi:MAG TPA: translation initiation factor IF-3 [Thermoanaerobaculia bacterium]|nr:translation initiation factor IF-3 [Thermoanaerobaculia bacterium]